MLLPSECQANGYDPTSVNQMCSSYGSPADCMDSPPGWDGGWSSENGYSVAISCSPDQEQISLVFHDGLGCTGPLLEGADHAYDEYLPYDRGGNVGPLGGNTFTAALCSGEVPTMTPTISPAPTITSAPTSVYHHPPEMKCMLDALSVDDSRWSPGGYVPTTLAGVDECATICSDHKYFGLQCPTSSGRVQCQCANSLTGSITQPDSDCRGGTAHGQCMGPFTAGDYLLGGYERASVYSNHRTLFFVVVT